MIKKMKNDKDVFIEKRGDMIISIDFGHKDDVAVETIFRKDKSGKQPVKDNWYWCSTRRENKHNFVLDWNNGDRLDNNQVFINWVRPVSNIKIR